VTPLIDIVMVLIIFFLLVAKIGVATGAEPMELPATVSGLKIEDMGNTITLNIRPGPADQPFITYLPKDQSANQEIKLVETAGGQVRRPLLEVLKAFRARNPEFKVIIRAEKDLHYRFLEPVLITCAEADVKNVNFNTAKVSQRVEE
jgi:biopolymer transport protein ExbD